MQYASVRQVISQPPLGKNPAINQECQVSIIFLENLLLMLLDVRIKTLFELVTAVTLAYMEEPHSVVVFHTTEFNSDFWVNTSMADQLRRLLLFIIYQIRFKDKTSHCLNNRYTVLQNSKIANNRVLFILMISFLLDSTGFFFHENERISRALERCHRKINQILRGGGVPSPHPLILLFFV